MTLEEIIFMYNLQSLIDESKEKELFKISNNIYSMQEYEKFDRKMWLEEMEYRHKNNLACF